MQVRKAARRSPYWCTTRAGREVAICDGIFYASGRSMRRRTSFLILCCHWVAVGAIPSQADAQERLNGLELGFSHTLQILRTSPSEAEAGSSENLVGFTLAYERLLIPGRLSLVVAKPFHFTKDRFDSPLDVLVKVGFVEGRWEPFVSVGISGNLRLFSGELEQEEGKRIEYTFGIGSIVGCTYVFTPRWGLTLEVGYFYFVNGLAQHGIVDALSGVWFF